VAVARAFLAQRVQREKMPLMRGPERVCSLLSRQSTQTGKPPPKSGLELGRAIVFGSFQFESGDIPRRQLDHGC
jgi:hypothetical protein